MKSRDRKSSIMHLLPNLRIQAPYSPTTPLKWILLSAPLFTGSQPPPRVSSSHESATTFKTLNVSYMRVKIHNAVDLIGYDGPPWDIIGSWTGYSVGDVEHPHDPWIWMSVDETLQMRIMGRRIEAVFIVPSIIEDFHNIEGGLVQLGFTFRGLEGRDMGEIKDGHRVYAKERVEVLIPQTEHVPDSGFFHVVELREKES